VTGAFGFVSSAATDSWWRSFVTEETALSSGSVTRSPLFFVYKTPYGKHGMRNRDVNTTFPENLRDPVDAQPAALRFQDLTLELS
jgi:hypothetical protein